jgi:prepilin-type N-terminal cleavage/methylation domain-containing protein
MSDVGTSGACAQPRRCDPAGYTLVEVVVVVVIVTVLAAVGIGVYMSYVDAARQAGANNLAVSLASFCASCRNANGLPDREGAALAAGTIVECRDGSMGTASWEVPEGYTVRLSHPGSGGTMGVVVATSDEGVVSHTCNW